MKAKHVVGAGLIGGAIYLFYKASKGQFDKAAGLGGFGASAAAASSARAGTAGKIRPVKVSQFQLGKKGSIIDVYAYPNYRVLRPKLTDVPNLAGAGRRDVLISLWRDEEALVISRKWPDEEGLTKVASFKIGGTSFGVWTLPHSSHPEIRAHLGEFYDMYTYEVPAYFGNHLITFVRRGHAPLGRGFGGQYLRGVFVAPGADTSYKAVEWYAGQIADTVDNGPLKVDSVNPETGMTQSTAAALGAVHLRGVAPYTMVPVDNVLGRCR